MYKYVYIHIYIYVEGSSSTHFSDFSDHIAPKCVAFRIYLLATRVHLLSEFCM